MIDTIRLCDRRYHLSFMLVGDEGYIRHLRIYADRVAPGRVTFLDPVAPDQIMPKIASFDMGIYLLQPTNYNSSIALPNKLFDFIHAGLAVCVGPSPGMAAFVRECGAVWSRRRSIQQRSRQPSIDSARKRFRPCAAQRAPSPLE